MTSERIAELRAFYLRELTGDTIPFWLERGLDREQGGLLDFLDRAGRPLSTDKGGWIQGRFAWVLSRLAEAAGGAYPELLPAWLEGARSCADFTRDKVLSGPGGRAGSVSAASGLASLLPSSASFLCGCLSCAPNNGPPRPRNG